MTGIHSGARTIRWRWIAALWCAGGLFEATQSVLIMRFGEGRDGAWLPLFATSLATWLPWALATPWIISLTRRYRIHRGMGVRTIIVHLAAFATISAVAEAWSALLQVLFSPWGNRQPPTFWDTWSITLLYQVVMFLIAYALILTITYLVDSRENVARQMTETARLNEELSRAQLAALRRQMGAALHVQHAPLHRRPGTRSSQRGGRQHDRWTQRVPEWQTNGGVGLANLRTRLQIRTATHPSCR